MFYDPLQKKLEQMEKENPSLSNSSPKIKDRIYFLARYIKGSVESEPERDGSFPYDHLAILGVEKLRNYVPSSQ